MSVVEDFAELFQGRTDAWGAHDGGCVRNPGVDMRTVYYRHLRGDERVGVYPIVWHDHLIVDDGTAVIGEWDVRWGCVDFDIKSDGHPTYDFEFEQEAHDAAVNLARVLGRLGIPAWIERTRSRGRHVWVFASEWVPASIMRRALLVASSVAGTPVREVNPKQESLADTALGNYVRLPYPGMLEDAPTSKAPQAIISPYDERMTLTLHEFVEDALQGRPSAAVFEEAASLYQEPRPVERRQEQRPAIGVYSAYVRKMVEEGPMEGSDRSAFLYRLANKAYEGGMAEEDAWEAVSEAADNCGKFVGRRDREKQIDDIIRKVY